MLKIQQEQSFQNQVILKHSLRTKIPQPRNTETFSNINKEEMPETFAPRLA